MFESWQRSLEDGQDLSTPCDDFRSTPFLSFFRPSSWAFYLLFLQEDIDWLTFVTAQTFFHYYYAKHSFRRHPRFNVLVACFFLAGKVTECPNRAARDLTALVLRANRLWLRRPATADPRADLSDDQLAQLKRDVLSCERTLLHAIAFDLIVPNPQKFVMEKIKLAAFDTPTVPPDLKKAFGAKIFEFLKYAMRTSLCLQYPPSYLAAAAVRVVALP